MTQARAGAEAGGGNGNGNGENGGNGDKVDIPNRIQEVARREEEDKTRETALLIYTVLATPIRPPTHTRATHKCTHTHICAHNHATHRTFSNATGARDQHPFQDRDIRSEVTTLFPRSRHPERGDDTLSKIETSGARCRHQQQNQTTKPKSSARTYAMTFWALWA